MSESGTWSEGNQRALGAALQELRLFLEEHAAAAKEAPGPGEADFRQAHEQVVAAEGALSTPSALARLTSVFGLSPFESRLLLLCAAVELDGRFSSLCEAAGGEGHSGVTYGLALAALPGAHWEALAPGSPLRYWRLIEVGPGPTLTASPLRIDERILHFLTGTQATDERLPLSTLLLPEDAPLSEPDRAAAAAIAESWASQFRPVVQVSGKDRELQLALVRGAAELLNMDFEILPAAAVPTAAREAQNLARLWNREIALDDRVLVIECDEWGEGDRALERSMAIVLGEVQGPVAVCTRDRLTFGSVATVLVEAPAATDASQKEAWRRALGDRFAPLAPEVERLATQFRLSTPLIDAAAGIAAVDENASPQDTGKALWDYCRRQARPRLDALAERIDTTAAWDDLVLPDAQTAMLREIVAQVRYRARVYGQWGFGVHGGRSQGATSLFAGPSGTGKTFAAEILASDLHLDLYRIDLSAVVSKYIGETEKNLRRVFDAAEDGGAILLFDEADALFGKRSDVKDSHDRYANIEVSYLLQRMEAYRGLAILTTNMRQALDPAFLRRLRFVVEFPFPGPEERAAIWQRSIPAAAPTQDVDVGKLARLAMTGGNIRNICLSAAFAAAADGGVIRMKHLLHGARAESLKLERTLSEAETRDWC